MRTQILLLIVILSFAGLSACENNDAELDQLKQTVRMLAEENEGLKLESSDDQEHIEDITSLITDIFADLEAISQREELIREIRREGESGNLTKDNPELLSSQMKSHVVAIEAHIAQTKQRQAYLQRVLGSSRQENADLKNTIESLNRLIAQKDVTIRGLRSELNTLSTEYTNLQVAHRGLETNVKQLVDSVQTLETKVKDLRIVHYVVGELDSLEANGIIRRTGGFLGFGRKTRIASLDQTLFNHITVEADTLRLGVGLDKLKIISAHKDREDLFNIIESDTETLLAITDPARFWDISNFLIIESR